MDNFSFENNVANKQNLTFEYIKKSFGEIGIDISNKNIMKSLSMMDKQEKYTNLALLLSDQNTYTFKIAVYPTTDKLYFLDRKEFSGSLLEIYDKTLDYLKLNSATYGLIDGTIRKDIEEYPEFIIREILLNSLIHRDYSTLTSNIINKITVVTFNNLQYSDFVSIIYLKYSFNIIDNTSGIIKSINPLKV